MNGFSDFNFKAALKPADSHTYADTMRDRIVTVINDFEKNIDNDHIAALRINNSSIIIEGVRYYNPYLIVFDGRLHDGSYVQAVQHVTQVNLLLVSTPRSDTSKPRRKIGFAQEHK